MAETHSSVRQKLIALLALIPLLTALVVGLSVDSMARDTITREQAEFGRAMATQVADHMAEYVVDGDVLSLNVIASRLTREASLASVAVYDGDNALIAQGGKASRGDETYAADITFQDSLAGSVRVTVLHSDYSVTLLVSGFIIAYLAYLICLIWFFPVVESWLFRIRQAPSDPELPKPEDYTEATPEIDEGPKQECILVIRIRPARHLKAHFEKFYQAANLYGGIVEQTTTEELVIHFESHDALYMAACAGLLIQQIATRVHNNISFGGTLDRLGDEPDKIRKSASYLASIAEGDLIVAASDSGMNDRVDMQSFRHALVDSDKLSRIAGLKDQMLLDSQADQLAAQFNK